MENGRGNKAEKERSGSGEGGAERVCALGQWTHFAQPIGLLSPLPWHIISSSHRAPTPPRNALQLAALDLRSCASSDTESDTCQCGTQHSAPAIFISLFAAAQLFRKVACACAASFLLHNLPARQIYGQIRTDSMRLDRSVTSRFSLFLAACTEVVRVVWGMLVGCDERIKKETETLLFSVRVFSIRSYIKEGSFLWLMMKNWNALW